MEWILLVLAAAVLVFGIGVVLWNRRRSATPVAPAPTARPLPSRPSPPPQAPTEEPASEAAAGEPEPLLTEPEATAEPQPEVPAERPTFRSRMGKARSALTGAFLGIRGRRGITDDTWDDLEEALLRADVGVRVTDELLGGLKARVKAKEITEPDALLDALQAEMTSRLDGADRSLRFEPGQSDSPNVWLFVGVNGVGKTTTIGKVANRQKAEGRSVLLAAGDTFRAATAEQLTTWAERSGAELVRGNEGGDPSAVIFDGIERASALVAAVDVDAANSFITLSARAFRPELFIVSRARSTDSEEKLLRAGADRVVNPQNIGGARMAAFVLRPHVAEFLDVVMHERNLEFRLEELGIDAASPIAGQTLRDAHLRDRTGALVLALRDPAGRFLTNPPPDTSLEPGHVLIAIGTGEELAALAEVAAG